MSPSPERIVAIDLGSQSVKVALVDPFTGELIDRATQQLRPTAHPKPGHVVHPDDDIWDSLCRATRELMGRAEGTVQLIGVGLCAMRYCRAHLDARGQLVEPMLSWMDARVREPLPPGIPRVSSAGGYLAWRLTGRFADTAADYTGFWPLDLATNTWRPDGVASHGMGVDQLPELVPPSGLLGKITDAAAQATGIPSGTAVYATANDKAVEALGAGLRRPEQALISLGTYIAAMTPLADPGSPKETAYWINDAAVPGEYLAESQGVRRGMWTVSWFRELVGLPSGEGERTLEAEAISVPAGSGGLLVMPDWLATPEAPHRRGALIGFDGTQGRGEIYRAIVEGIAVRISDHLLAMEFSLGRVSSEVTLSGGGAKSPLLAGIFAALLRRPVRVARVTDAAVVGAAICAAVGAGVYRDADAAVSAMVHLGVSMHASSEQVAAYAECRTRYHLANAQLDGLYRKLYA